MNVLGSNFLLAKVCSKSLLPGVNFTNILRSAFTCEDPKNAKRQSSHQCLFALLGSTQARAPHKMLVKSITSVSQTISKLQNRYL